MDRQRYVKAATRALGLATLVAGIAVSAAPAAASTASDTYAVASQPMLLAQQIARQNWNADGCNGQVTISWVTLPATINAQSTWANPTDAYANPSQNTLCSIQFNDSITWDWDRFCTVVVHEYGHLTGHPHSLDPADVMYAYYTTPLAACVAADPTPQVPAAPPATDPLTRATTIAPVSPAGSQSAVPTAHASAHVKKVHETHRVKPKHHKRAKHHKHHKRHHKAHRSARKRG